MHIFIFILGVIYRLFLIKIVPQPVFIGDQYDYHRFAQGILDHGLFALSSRLYGYPLFLAIIYLIFGIGNSAIVIVFQAVLDTLTAFLLFDIARMLFNSRKIQYIVLFIYLFNPFTSNFAGLILTEVLSVFLMTLVFWLFLKALMAHKPFFLFLLAAVLGYLPQVRPPFLFFTMAVVTAILIIQKKLKIGIILFAIYLLPFAYNLLGNKVYFGEYNLLTVDNIFVREFYISMFIDRSPAHDTTLKLDEPMYMFPQEVKNIYNEITPLPKNKYEREQMTKKYFWLGIEELKKDPYKFISMHIRKMWYVWEKHFIFYYYEPSDKLKDLLIYWGNTAFLFLGVLGLGRYLRESIKNKDTVKTLFSIMVAFLLIYISVIHSFSLSEERYSLPAYPFVFLFASFYLYRLRKA